MICSYGCEREGLYLLKNGKWCCEKFYQKCPNQIKKSKKRNSGENSPMFGKKHSDKTKRKIGNKSKGKIISKLTKKKMSIAHIGMKKQQIYITQDLRN